MKRPVFSILLLAGHLGCATTLSLQAGDQPQWGQRDTRNMVSSEKGLADTFDPASGKNIRWSVPLGTETHGSAIVANGRVYIGTNNGEPREAKHEGDRGVLLCLDEKDGHLLWQLVVPKREEDPFHDWPKSGIASPPTVEGDNVYVVSNRGEVMCLDARGMANGNDGPFKDEQTHMTPAGKAPIAPGPLDADIRWVFDLTAGAGIWSHDGAHSSILVRGRYLYLNTGTGVDNTHKRIRTPDAPSLVVIDKETGRLVARDHEVMAPQVFHCTWSSPSFAEVNGKPLLFFGGGNGILYAFETLTIPPPPGQVLSLKKVWQFDFDPTAPKENVHLYSGNKRESPSNFYGMPVFDRGLLYLAGGGDIWWGKNEAWLKCIDPTGTGDITRTAQRWSYPLEKHVLSTAAVVDGLVFIADVGRKLHCVDAKTGQAYWTHETKGEIWASPLVADGKVYLGTRRGDFYVFTASREKQLLNTLELGSPVSATASAANGVLYVATMKQLFAIEKKSQ